MCRIDYSDDGKFEALKEGTRTARKEYKCEECRRIIAIGERYFYEFGKCEGYADTHRTCLHCMVARDWLLKNCGGWIYSEVVEEIKEHGEEYPKITLPLYRLVVGARRKWKAFSGGMMPLPKMPPALEVAMN